MYPKRLYNVPAHNKACTFLGQRYKTKRPGCLQFSTLLIFFSSRVYGYVRIYENSSLLKVSLGLDLLLHSHAPCNVNEDRPICKHCTCKIHKHILKKRQKKKGCRYHFFVAGFLITRGSKLNLCGETKTFITFKESYCCETQGWMIGKNVSQHDTALLWYAWFWSGVGFFPCNFSKLLFLLEACEEIDFQYFFSSILHVYLYQYDITIQSRAFSVGNNKDYTISCADHCVPTLLVTESISYCFCPLFHMDLLMLNKQCLGKHTVRSMCAHLK